MLPRTIKPKTRGQADRSKNGGEFLELLLVGVGIVTST
jgi:hypothetical protein